MKNWICLLGILVIISCSKESKEYDLLIQQASVIDGSGSPAFVADVGILGDSIAFIGRAKKKRARDSINGVGLVLAPGFIDMHTHCDWGFEEEETHGNLNYLMQGVTSVVTGNCGYGSGEIEDMCDRYSVLGIGNNAIPMTGFGWLREQVMGDENRAPTESEIIKMKALLKTSLEQGSWGMTSGLQYIPEKYSSTEEIMGLAQGLAQFNALYSTHMRSEEDELIEAVEEAIAIARFAKVPLNIAHLKANGRKNFEKMPRVIELVKDAQKAGMKITADMYPYDKSSTMVLADVFLLPPQVPDLMEGLANKKDRELIRELTEKGRDGQVNWVAKGGWNFFSIVYAPEHPEVLNKMFIDLADVQGTTPFDVAADLVLAEGRDIIISLSTMLEENLRLQLQQDWVMLSSDGSAVNPRSKGVHPRNYGSQTRLIRKYVNEDQIISLEEAVYKMSGLPAETLGLKRRGLLKEGYVADLVLFDPDEIRDNATFLEPHQYPDGINSVWVNGVLVVENGEFNSIYPGRVLLKTVN